jgi:hypothetical protein
MKSMKEKLKNDISLGYQKDNENTVFNVLSKKE